MKEAAYNFFCKNDLVIQVVFVTLTNWSMQEGWMCLSVLEYDLGFHILF